MNEIETHQWGDWKVKNLSRCKHCLHVITYGDWAITTFKNGSVIVESDPDNFIPGYLSSDTTKDVKIVRGAWMHNFFDNDASIEHPSRSCAGYLDLCPCEMYDHKDRILHCTCTNPEPDLELAEKFDLRDHISERIYESHTEGENIVTVSKPNPKYNEFRTKWDELHCKISVRRGIN